MLVDNHGRVINYLRVAVTDRCNLRCYYCMPENGIDWLARKELMSYEELLRLCSILVQSGIEKIRITGGEPFVRKDILHLLAALKRLNGLRQLTITTNGVLTAPLVPEVKRLGIQSVNLSLDTLDRNRFFAITRRDELPKVISTLEQLLRYNIETKINAVVMEGKNIEDIGSLVELTKNSPVCVRFIEEMPFNGNEAHYSTLFWDHVRILDKIRERYPTIQKVKDPPYSTAYHYHIPGHKGRIGIIAAYTRSFCGSCNRIRITPEGMLKTCLYDNGVLNVKELFRSGLSDTKVQALVTGTLQKRAKTGWEVEQQRTQNIVVHESMATIGG